MSMGILLLTPILPAVTLPVEEGRRYTTSTTVIGSPSVTSPLS
jgi:hypothetical protein